LSLHPDQQQGPVASVTVEDAAAAAALWQQSCKDAGIQQYLLQQYLVQVPRQ
jgi:hypothetical protein